MPINNNLADSLNNILNIIDAQCTDAAGDVHVDPAHLEAFSEETSYIASRMGLTPFQAVLFAVIIQCHASNRCSLNHIGKALGMGYLQMLSYSSDLYSLRDRWLIRIKGNGDIRVPQEVINALMQDVPFERPRLEGLNTRVIMRKVFSLMKQANDGMIQPQQLMEEIDLMVAANPETSFSKASRKYLDGVGDTERLLFYALANLYYNMRLEIFDMGDVSDFIQDDAMVDEIRDGYEAGDLVLQQKGIIEPTSHDGFRARGCFSFKEEVTRELFADAKRMVDTMKTVDLTESADKPVKELFYNPDEKKQIERLHQLLMPESLKNVLSSMKEKGLRTGFSCLFYGAPGTGKTETVYQLARRTGRKILEADVAKLRNCYVGETEKNVRNLFADYRIACSENDLNPILLFNEADAILGTRMEGAVRSVDRMENSVQNILLQEMESFSGILIATTNLLGNLDPAFERRFLYKVRFNKPELDSRVKIWKSQFPDLSDKEALEIAGEFPFSGGQIENIVRKSTVDSILSGEPLCFDQLRQYCLEEAVDKKAGKRIGF